MKKHLANWPWDRFLLIRSLSRGSGSHFSLKTSYVSIFFFSCCRRKISISHLSIPMAWELAGSEEDHLNEVELRATHHHLSLRGQTTIRSSVLGQLELLAPMHMSGNHD